MSQTTTVIRDLDAGELEITVEWAYHPAEPPTRHYPGCQAEVEILASSVELTVNETAQVMARGFDLVREQQRQAAETRREARAEARIEVGGYWQDLVNDWREVGR